MIIILLAGRNVFFIESLAANISFHFFFTCCVFMIFFPLLRNWFKCRLVFTVENWGELVGFVIGDEIRDDWKFGIPDDCQKSAFEVI